MRDFIRHPTDIPFEYTIMGVKERGREKLTNISHGGLSFQSDRCLDAGTELIIRIPLREPPFRAHGLVVWCRDRDGRFEIGVEFTDPQTERSLRMIEQIAYIEHYKRKVREKEGRHLSGEEAAFEWINKYASNFPY